MITIAVELVCMSDESQLQIWPFLEKLGEGIRSGFFICGNNLDLSNIRIVGIQRLADTLRLSVVVSDVLIAEPSIIESIFLPVLDPDEYPSVLKKILLDPPLTNIYCPFVDPFSHVNELVSKGWMGIPEVLDPTQPFSIWIKLNAPLNTEQIEIFRQSIDIFEELLSSAPFLSLTTQDYSGIGQTQLNWLGSTICQYWIEAIATEALWLPMIANLLFRGTAISGVKHVEIEQ